MTDLVLRVLTVHRVMRVAAATIWMLIHGLIGTQAIAAQSISGQLVDETMDQPIRGGFVVLLGSDNQELARTLTDGRGQFHLAAPAAGQYRLKSVVIGVRSTMTPPIELAADQALEVRFAIPAIVVRLPTLVVEEERTCRGPPQEGLAAATLWEESRKALNAVAWTARLGTLQHSLVTYERRLDPINLEIAEARRRASKGTYVGSPFKTAPADQLDSLGYIQKSASGRYSYYGPDANVLLSEEFAAAHCFAVVSSNHDRPGLVGLAFEPVPGRTLPDIEGVLWLDQESAELRFLEYRYTAVPYGLQSPYIGGRVEFERLPVGPWIVRRWRVRMPIVGMRRAGYSEFIAENYLTGIKEDGGWVSEIRTLAGELVARGGVTTLRGTAYDLERAIPLARARIILVGTEHEAITDARGRFRMTGLPEGTYRVSYGHEILDALGFVPPLVEVSVSLERTPSVTLVLPPTRSLWSRLCPASDATDGVGIVSGFARDVRTGRAVSGVQLLALRASDDGSVLSEGLSDWAGYYWMCNVPSDEDVIIEARRAGAGGVTTDRVTARFGTGDVVRVDFTLQAPPPGTP